MRILRAARGSTFFLALAACKKEAPPAAPAPAPLPVASAPRSIVSAALPPAAAPAPAPALALPADAVTKVHREPRFSWRQIQLVNWQAVADDLPPLPAEPSHAATHCTRGQALVSGNLLLDSNGRDDTDQVLELQNRTCLFWRTHDRSIEGLCDRFDRPAWLSASAGLPRKKLAFCIDRYEFPNQYGQFPLVGVTFAEAAKHCERVSKRLCNENEWTLACEGEEGMPYPYGYERDREACRIDVLAAGPDDDTFSPRTTEHTARGIDFAWHGLRSGEMPRCKSPFEVFDLTGNVDEWTSNARKYGRKMILKGGHWGPARQRCRPQTRGHGPAYNRYDSGFRCCADAPP